MPNSGSNRRQFLKTTGLAATSLGALGRGLAMPPAVGAVVIVADQSDAIVSSTAVRWAIEHLAASLKAAGVTVKMAASVEDASGSLVVIASSASSHLASGILLAHKVSISQTAEALAIVPEKHAGKPATLLACGYDIRGLVYALTELSDIVQNSPSPFAELMAIETKTERPANKVRSLTRLFCSEPEDKPWYNDREMWPAYFDMLASQRFNRFNLAFGIGYDFITKVTDAYFLFTYPFLLKVPHYQVHVPQLPDSERESNLEMLRFIGAECVKRGIEFHVGLWMHGYEWIDSPNPNYTIVGLDKTNHGAYCRDALQMLLREVPDIQGLTFRIHGESGVAEGSFEFWKTVFDGVKLSGRRVPIDMHAKGMSQQMLDIAVDTGLTVQLTPKFWGEHMGMPYHQADIRVEEKPKATDATGLMALSSGTRSFLRYSYGDLLAEDRKWTVVHRVWPGTQRLLLWGDPQFASGYSRAFHFCGTDGVELMEMLSFKGRRGSGHAGDRCAYQDASYKVRWDWQKYEYGTRVWGRMLYNPDTHASVPGRLLVKQFGPGAADMGDALANVSRILPIVTSAYAPSAGNNTYWPELYLNESMVDSVNFGPYGDSPRPRVFGTASPFDPEMFDSVNGYADDLLEGKSSGKYSPIEVASWLEGYAAAGRKAQSRADGNAAGRGTGAYRRAKLDILIQAGLGEFYGAKLRSGVLFHFFEKTGSKLALEAAIQQYQAARGHWANLAQLASGVYMSDITLGETVQLRGHWTDRLPAIDKDIAALSALLNTAGETSATVKSLIPAVLGSKKRIAAIAKHQVPARFSEGQDLTLSLSTDSAASQVVLRYRHVNQAEYFVALPMTQQGKSHHATIPSKYTTTKYPIEYFFEIVKGSRDSVVYPGFTPDLSNQPYFVVRSI